MIVLEENSVYSIWREYTLSYNDREVLMWLYCPIVGAEAISLYNMLDTLIGNKNRYDSMFNSDLAKRLAISINELDLNRKKQLIFLKHIEKKMFLELNIFISYCHLPLLKNSFQILTLF